MGRPDLPEQPCTEPLAESAAIVWSWSQGKQARRQLLHMSLLPAL